MVIGGGWREEGIRSRRRRRQMQGINDEVAGRSQRRSGGAVALGAVRGGGGVRRGDNVNAKRAGPTHIGRPIGYAGGGNNPGNIKV